MAEECRGLHIAEVPGGGGGQPTPIENTEAQQANNILSKGKANT